VRGVFKIGGSVVNKTPMPIWVDELKARILAHDQIVVVHGGGSLISRELEARGEPVQFVQGQRVTSDRALTVVLWGFPGLIWTCCKRCPYPPHWAEWGRSRRWI